MNDPRQPCLFAEPEARLERLWTAWTTADERARRVFLERVRKHYLFGGREARRQAEAKATDAKGVA